MSAAAILVGGASATLVVLGLRRVAGSRPAPRRGGARQPGPVARRPAGARLGLRLARAGIALGPDAAVAICAGAALASAAAGYAVLRTPIAAALGAAAAIGAVAALLATADRRHLDRLESQLPGVAQQLSAALAAGLSLRQALARAARDAPEPVGAELARCVAELELGGRLDAVLESLAERVPARELRIMTTAILVQRRTGGNLALALGRLSDRLEERAQLARELRGATAQARMTAWLVAGLPLAGGALTEVASPGTLARDLGQGPGPFLLAASMTLYAVGVLLIRRIGRVDP